MRSRARPLPQQRTRSGRAAQRLDPLLQLFAPLRPLVALRALRVHHVRWRALEEARIGEAPFERRQLLFQPRELALQPRALLLHVDESLERYDELRAAGQD